MSRDGSGGVAGVGHLLIAGRLDSKQQCDGRFQKRSDRQREAPCGVDAEESRVVNVSR